MHAGDEEKLCRKTSTGDGTVSEKKKRKSEGEMAGLCQHMRAIATTEDEVHDRTGWRIISTVTPQLSRNGYSRRSVMIWDMGRDRTSDFFLSCGAATQ